MTREELLHAIRAACDLLDVDEVLVVGSQAILGSWSEADLPGRATRSMEADIAKPHDVADRGSATLAGILGEGSSFHEMFGIFVDGVSEDTALLPRGWPARAVRLSTNSAVRGREVVGICPDATDLCVSKLCALREKDQSFVSALIGAGRVRTDEMIERLPTVPNLDPRALARATAWLRAQP